MTPQLVVTLPSHAIRENALIFARKVRSQGAQLLEIRNDLHEPDAVDARRLAAILPLLISERKGPLPKAWVDVATHIDCPLEKADIPTYATIVSHHSSKAVQPQDVLALWKKVPPTRFLVKHVEPLDRPSNANRLLETQRLLLNWAGSDRATVLATGELALPFRCVLAQGNCFDFVAAEPKTQSAVGQRLLVDAVREHKYFGQRSSVPPAFSQSNERTQARRAIIGSNIPHSRSPRIHRQPFDRIDVPASSPIGELVDSLHSAYLGLAITAPFKKALAKHVDSDMPAINTLVRTKTGWNAFNTDVAGARAVVKRLRANRVVALGDGGATAALRISGAGSLTVIQRQNVGSEPLRGDFIWTWPETLAPPPTLRFDEARVAIIAYGEPAHRIAREVRARGGIPIMLGATWFVAQAREQRRLWEQAQ